MNRLALAAVIATSSAAAAEPAKIPLTTSSKEAREFGAGDKKAALTMARRAAEFHAFSPTYPYVRTKAASYGSKR
jgi:hypothetical protein